MAMIKASGSVNSNQKEERANSYKCHHDSLLQYICSGDCIVVNCHSQSLVTKVGYSTQGGKQGVDCQLLRYFWFSAKLLGDGCFLELMLCLLVLIQQVNDVVDSKKYDLPGYAVLNTSKGYLTIELFKDAGPKHEAFMVGTTKVKEDSKAFQLFITTAPIPDLNDKLFVLGRVIKGEDVVQVRTFSLVGNLDLFWKIEEIDTNEHYQPKSPIGIIDVTLQQEI
ncbi:Cyclophilin-like peptidyl-prolyl cis-trans isomerase family protein [Theobroma cacao]|uniref:Cyclophilin-like peptidyl-prolyl cis-trans isomerase family protein n=1 Tax=Theobroma cacao TaxID=3641 RepID=A0A061ENY1_THECC|nr:Cyclophilin-like peptidyl-prolyl cis-trans isomerase family protein [Theobroma cacao]